MNKIVFLFNAGTSVLRASVFDPKAKSKYNINWYASAGLFCA